MIRATGVALLAVLVGTVSACSTGGRAGGDSGFVSGDGSIVYLEPAERSAPVSLSGTTLEGKPWSLADFRGQPVVLNVWGSWCSPCRAEAKDLEKAWQQLKPKNVAMAGINFRDSSPEAGLAFQRTFGVTYPSVFDKDGTVLLNLHGVVSPKSIPSTVVIDAQSRVAARISGQTSTTTLVDLVEQVSAADAKAPATP